MRINKVRECRGRRPASVSHSFGAPVFHLRLTTCISDLDNLVGRLVFVLFIRSSKIS
ncbi:hypothetical protein P691DRAFT_812523 [Macrolepiota fuliginosa MF-IS2]|uniref:Uncharacterized protein n=1 Tax=Macrolepiota fuliginosa MF-IS2 TaxID=1400762 RepID=A0A9P5XDM0_9AGAR|nr:hypothetical protein P691DRAFT_809737 [Macrolepiota fuliginosa MF-IS2]KAF9449433.1 hypothetical protein P691DRAFT_812523 [Macrolepiota fuliginosa MF-IS2]